MRELLKNSRSLLYRRQTNILSAASILMATYALSHLIGLFKTRLLISYFFGLSSAALDVYYAAFVVPDTLFQLLVIGSLSAAFIPVFTRYLSRKESEAWQIAAASLNIVLVAFTLISALIFLFAHPIASILAPGFTPDQLSTMTSLIRVMLVAQIFFAVSGFLTGMIQSHQRFLIPALAPVVYNLGIIAGIVFLSPSLGIFGPAVGVVIGAALHMLIQLPVARSLGFRFIPGLNFSHPGVREIIRLMPPRALALGIDQVELLVAVVLASTLSAGSLTLLNVARLLYSLPSTLFGVTLGQAALPTLSRLAGDPDRDQFRRTLFESGLQAVFFSLPLTVLFIVLRIPIVRLVFGARSFPWLATLTTGKTLAILSISVVFVTLMQIIIRAFYALHDTRTPLLVGGVAALFNTLLATASVYIFHFGILGLAFAITATSILESIVLLVFLIRLLGPTQYQDFYRPFFKISVVGIVMGVSLWIPMRLLDQFVFDTTRTLPLVALTVITSSIGFSVYLFLSYLFRVEELHTFIDLLKRLSKWHHFITSPAPSPVLASAPDRD